MGRGAKSEGKNGTLLGRDLKGREEFAKLKEKQGSGGWMGRSYHHPCFRKGKLCKRKHTMHTRVHNSIIHNSPELEAAQRLLHRCEGEWDMVCPNGGMLLSHKRE